MNKKLIAVAVSSAVMAPVAAQAADVTVYGRINNAIEIRDTDGFRNDGGDSTVDVSSISSRFGIKASSDLGNGLTASARYEFATVTDKELPNPADLRIGTVGISGGFGSITVGNQWSAFYDTVGTDIDPTYSVGYVLYSSIVNGPYRGSNTIKYANSFGPVYLELDVRLNESEEGSDVAEKINGDGVGIGARWSVTDNLTLAAAFDSEENPGGAADTDRTGVSAKWASGGWFAIVGWHEADNGGNNVASQTQFWGGVDLGDATRLMFGYGVADNDANDSEPEAFTLAAYHNMGGGLRFYYEGAFHDFDDTRADFDRHILGMRIDF